jgi:hypothetical protein
MPPIPPRPRRAGEGATVTAVVGASSLRTPSRPPRPQVSRVFSGCAALTLPRSAGPFLSPRGRATVLLVKRPGAPRLFAAARGASGLALRDRTAQMSETYEGCAEGEST